MTLSRSVPIELGKHTQVPKYSAFFEVFTKIRGSEGRESRLVYFNHERGMFYVAESGQDEELFRGPSNALTTFAYVENGSIKFPPSSSSTRYEFIESIFPARTGTQEVIDMTHTQINLDILGVALGSQKPIGHAPSTSPDYFPPTGQPPAPIFKK